MAKDFDLDWATFAGQTGKDLRNTANRAGMAVEAAPTGGTGNRLNLVQDITAAVSAIAAEGQNYIVLQWTGNAGSADLYGKASDNAPVLLITTSNETLYTATFTETNSLTPAVTIYSEAETSTTVTIGADGWATLFTDKALNFAGSGLKAYTATCDGATVTLTEVATVPANTAAC